MGKKSKKNNRGRKRPSNRNDWNFVSEAGPGCFIARHDKPNDWIVEWEPVNPKEFEREDVPDVAIDTEERTLSFCNVENCTKVAYITVFDTKVLGATGQELVQGTTTGNDGVTSPCVTFIVLCPPHMFVHLCFLDVPNNRDITATRIESDVQEWNQHPNPSDDYPMPLGFPLEGGPFLCTQGVGGELTHFFSGNLHAIDFRCPIGTPLLAVADGTVVEVKDTNTLTGVAVSNLFEWNSIMIKINAGNNNNNNNSGDEESAGPLFVEYVHIQKSSVKVGDIVKRGDTIGTSGSVGFSPEPHLHFSAFRSSDPEAPTVGIKFQSLQQQQQPQQHTTFVPHAGTLYDANGVVVTST